MQHVLKSSLVLIWLLMLLMLLMFPMLPGGSPALAQDDVSWLLTQINNLRAGQGLPAYTLNAQLSAAATRQSQYLTETCNVAHVWPDGATPSSRAAAAGYTGTHVLENIYAGTNADAASAWSFWTTSPSHYSTLTNDIVTEIGIGVAHGGLCSHAYTLVFGRAGDGSAPPIPPPANAGANPAAAAGAPPAPYIPPGPTRTPTATIPTLTPSATWTLTPSYTPSATFTAVTPAATPLNLPTLPAQDATAIAVVASATPTPVEITLTSTPPPPTLTPLSPTATSVPAARAAPRPDEQGITVRDLVPLALLGQIVLIGIAGFAYFRKTR